MKLLLLVSGRLVNLIVRKRISRAYAKMLCIRVRSSTIVYCFIVTESTTPYSMLSWYNHVAAVWGVLTSDY